MLALFDGHFSIIEPAVALPAIDITDWQTQFHCQTRIIWTISKFCCWPCYCWKNSTSWVPAPTPKRNCIGLFVQTLQSKLRHTVLAPLSTSRGSHQTLLSVGRLQAACCELKLRHSLGGGCWGVRSGKLISNALDG